MNILFNIEHGLEWHNNMLDVTNGHYPFDEGQCFKNQQNEILRAERFSYYPSQLKIIEAVHFVYIRNERKKHIVPIRYVIDKIKSKELKFTLIGAAHLIDKTIY